MPKVPQLVSGRTGTAQFGVLSDLPPSPLPLPSSSPELPRGSGPLRLLRGEGSDHEDFSSARDAAGKRWTCISALICVLGFGGDRIAS